MAALVPYHDRDGFIWYNGVLVPWREAKLHVLTHGLHYASAVFEGERAYGGVIFKLREHTERLFMSAGMLDFEIPYSPEAIDNACDEVMKANGLLDGYVRPIAWRGSEQMGVSAQTSKINVAVAAWDWGSYFDRRERLRGIRISIAQYRRPDPATIPAKAKATGLYTICTIEKHRAERAGYADALMYDWRGRIAECTGANVFFVKDGALHTPTPDCFLDGITRRTVIELANKRGIAVHERAIMPDELPTFSECFITGSAAEVTLVREIGPHHYQPGRISESLLHDYMAAVQPVQKAAAE
jgi:branched-chain amino acid aminotransferase